MADRAPKPSVAESLTLALIASSDAPLVLLDGNLWVIAASTSFGSAFHIDVGTAPGVEVCNLGAGEWNLPPLRSLLNATAAGHAAIEAYEMDLNGPYRPLRRLVIKAEKLAYGDPGATRIIFVDYESRGADWTLSVRDNGIGMPPEPTMTKPGLGTSIVEALARQLDATINVTSRRPGTKVSVGHAMVAAIQDSAPIHRAG